MNKFVIEKIEGFIRDVNSLKENLDYEKLKELDTKIEGFLRGAFDEEKVIIYENSVVQPPSYVLSIREKYTGKLRDIKNFLLSLKEEVEVKNSLGLGVETMTIDKVKEKAETSQKEAERRKNVAEFKYWGFAIELIDTVRKEFKEFRKIQEELLLSIKELKGKIDSNKK